MYCLQVGQVIQIEVGGGLRQGSQLLVQLAYKAHPAVAVHALPVAHYPVDRQVKVVGDDRAAEGQRGPDGLLKAAVFRIQFFLHPGRLVGNVRPKLDVAHAGVNVDHIRREGLQRTVVKDQVFIEQRVSALVEGGLDAVFQQKQLQDIFDLANGAAAHNGDFLFNQTLLLQQLALEAALFLQQVGRVQRIIKTVHGKIPPCRSHDPPEGGGQSHGRKQGPSHSV